MSPTKNNTNNNEIMTSSDSQKGGFHGFTAKEKRDLDLNDPSISTSLESFSPPIDLKLVPNAQEEVSGENNCLMAVEESQTVAPPLEFPSATQVAEDVHSSTADASVKFPFDLNVIADDDDDDVPISCSEEARAVIGAGTETKQPPTSDETKLPPSASADNTGELEAEQNSDVPPMIAADNDDEDRVIVVEEGANADEGGNAPQTRKRRRREECGECRNRMMVRRAFRGLRVIQEFENQRNTVIGDGFLWRKYGQKTLRQNPHPRSYYKCTTIGCTAKKHVERDLQNDRSVVTTYFKGKHNHEPPRRPNRIPVTVNDNVAGENVAPRANTIPTFALPGNLNIPNAAPLQVPYHPLGTATNQQFPSAFLGPNNNAFGGLYNNMNIVGSSSAPLMLSSTLNNANTMFTPFQPYGLNLGPYATPRPRPPMFPVFPTALPSNFASSSGGFPHAGFNANGSSSVFPFMGARVWYPRPPHRNN